MESESQNMDVSQASLVNRVTPFSKYLAMALFVVMPFIGGWIGYMHAPLKVVEVEKIEIKKPTVEPDFAESKINDIQNLNWKQHSLFNGEFVFQYPSNWTFSEFDSDSRSSIRIYDLNQPVELAKSYVLIKLVTQGEDPFSPQEFNYIGEKFLSSLNRSVPVYKNINQNTTIYRVEITAPIGKITSIEFVDLEQEFHDEFLSKIYVDVERIAN